MASEIETYEADEYEDGSELENHQVYEADGDNFRNYLEIGVDLGSESARLYFEGRDADGEVQAAFQYLDANELQALIVAAERALAVIEANS